MAGLVIVNADDLGFACDVSDSIIESYREGVITSASMMVWMEDSTRASSMARGEYLPTGLHLNLDTPFSSSRVPRLVKDAHARIRPWFMSHSHYLVSYNPSQRFRKALDICIEAQLDEFRARQGLEPSHIDGHHHVHMAWNVLASTAIPHGVAMRSTWWERNVSVPVRLLRLWRQKWLRHRFRTTDLFYDLRRILAASESGSRAPGLTLPGSQTVEVMAHPGVADEFAFLLSNSWRQMVADLTLGSFHELN